MLAKFCSDLPKCFLSIEETTTTPYSILQIGQTINKHNLTNQKELILLASTRISFVLAYVSKNSF